MSKKESSAESKKPPAAAEAPKEAPKGAPAHGGGGSHAAPPASSRSSSASAKVGCHATGCKEKDHRFNFCDEHFRQFKCGLINKSGDRVVDYERKLEHYQGWLKTQKVA